MSSPRKHQPLAVHDPTLGPVLRSHTGSDPRRTALAVAVRAHSAGIPSGTTRLWLRSRGNNRFATMTLTSRAWSRIATPARKRLAASTPGGAAAERMRLAACRALVGHLLSPIPDRLEVSDRQAVPARRVLAAVGLSIVDSLASEQPMDTALVSAKTLAVELGLGPRAVGAALRACVRAGWLREVSRRPGGMARYRLGRLTAAEGDVAWAHAELVDDLLDGHTDSDAVQVLRAVGHTAVAHHPDGGATGGKAWLFALAEATEAEPSVLGLNRRAVPAARRLWLGMISAEDVTVAIDLDAHAVASGAEDRKAVAVAKKREADALRRAEIETVRARRQKIRDALGMLLAAHPVPSPVAPVAKRDAWVEVVRTRLAADPMPAEWRRDFVKTFAAKLVVCGYPESAAQRVADHVAGTPGLGAAA